MDVYYGPVWSGRFFEKLMKIQEQYGKLPGQNSKKISKKCNLCL